MALLTPALFVSKRKRQSGMLLLAVTKLQKIARKLPLKP
jgi:hypothetical protein